ncbi:MAG: tRNA (N6-threonylcarbamoyladenosine(37)-N6)-methyltransferase TrmO [Lachnospiraceae bacterium]|nr:tRNA (N6-threonylcarbamoyladenosine(37)-N6)-methyltransferase TrmO [Lachnospiraceae bacterium]
MKTIARIKTDFPEKFGIPRQSSRIYDLKGEIVFSPEYRNPDAVKGLDGFDYLWLLWKFDVPEKANFTATVRPPRLGGNIRMGVFATRSPFRPNPIGLSCVRLDSVEYTPDGPVLKVSGVDMKDGTEIYDIKPYLPSYDSHPEAREGFAKESLNHRLEVDIPDSLLSRFPEEKRTGILAILADDPRPSYQDDPERIYGVSYSGFNIRFKVKSETLTVTDVLPISQP